jgi:hypothetical protein
MAVTSDGAQKFGPQTSTIASMVVESLSVTNTAERVDLNDGDGEPAGSTVIPGRVEMTATLQLGDQTAAPAIGSTMSIDSDTFLVTESSVEETQADYVRVNVSGYKKIAS